MGELSQAVAQRFQPKPLAGRDEDGLGMLFLCDRKLFASYLVNFVKAQQGWPWRNRHLRQDSSDSLDVALPGRMGQINHMQQRIRFGDFLQGGAKGIDQRGWQVMNKAHRVR